MIVYENEEYAVSQSETNKHIMIIKKLPDDKGEMIFHCQRKETEPMLTQEQGKKFLQNILDLISLL